MAGDPLLQPLHIRHLTLKNRVMSSAHEPAYADAGHPGARYQAYHEEKARGGLALTMIGGSTNVAPDSPSVFGQLYAGDDSIIPHYRALADKVHAHGAKVMSQLTHMGRRTVWDDGHWLPTIAPSSVREPAHRSFPKEMEEHDIRRVVSAFADAAFRCKEGGLDGVELIAYGHLIDQFWTPLVNRRTDRYGGSLENRMRFSMEVLAAVRERVGDDYIVGIRMSGTEDLEGGLTLEDCQAIAGGLVKTGMLDFVNVIKGFIASDEAISHVIPMYGTALGAHLPIAAAIKEVVDVPVFHAARINDLSTARHAIEAGLIDMVGMTRAHMADPHIVAKLERGEADRIRPCVGASFCINRLYLGLDALCLHNPATGRELTVPQILQRADEPRKVVVVGAGPGGLEAARASAERGHSVVLFEAADRPGGQVLLAARATKRRFEMIGIIDWLAREVELLGVDVRLNTIADPAHVLAEDPDVVFIATGGWPRIPDLDAGEDLVTSTWDVISGQTPVGDQVLVYDDLGNEQAMSCAERLMTQGVQVEIVSPDRHIGQEVTGTAYPPYLARFYEGGVTLTPDHRLERVERRDGRLVATLYNEYSKRSSERIVDTVIVEHGTEPVVDVFSELIGASVNAGEIDIDALIDGRPQRIIVNAGGSYRLFRVGDAVSSRNIHAAIYEARRLCRDL